MFVQRRLIRLACSTAGGPLIATSLLGLSATGFGIATGFVVAEAVRRVFDGGTPGDLMPIVAVGGALVLGRACATWLRDVTAHYTAGRVKTELRDRLTTHLFLLGPAYVESRPPGEVQATIADGVEALQAYVGFYLPQALVSTLAPLLLVGGMVLLDPVAGGIVFVAALVVPTARPLFRRSLGARGRDFWAAFEELAGRMLDALRGMPALKLLGAAERHGQQLDAAAVRLYHATVANLGISLAVHSIITLMMGVGTALAAGFGAIRLAQGHLDAAALLILLFLAAECFKPLIELQNYWHEGFYGIGAATGFFRLLDTQPTMVDNGTRTRRSSSIPPHVRFDTVTYTYPSANQPALDDVTLDLAPGTTTALVGPSGAGKSTIGLLLQRLADPQHGRILVDDVDLRDYTLTAARSLTAVVSQHVHLFHGTIADNLRLADPGADDASLWNALAAAQLAEVVAGLPGQLDARVVEQAATLSGGERQRLAIARALLKNAPILLLDEATSSLDGANEASVQQALAHARQGRTTLVIAHRLSSIVDADQLVVVAGGRIVDQGPPAELISRRDSWIRQVAAAQEGPR